MPLLEANELHSRDCDCLGGAVGLRPTAATPVDIPHELRHNFMWNLYTREMVCKQNLTFSKAPWI